MSDYIEGKKNCLKELILLSYRYEDIDKLRNIMKVMLKQTEEVFPDTEKYLE